LPFLSVERADKLLLVKDDSKPLTPKENFFVSKRSEMLGFPALSHTSGKIKTVMAVNHMGCRP